MSKLNAAQYEALFTNAFGEGAAAFGISIDASSDVAVGKVGAHTVELLMMGDTAVEWQVDASNLITWPGVLSPADPRRAQNATALCARIA